MPGTPRTPFNVAVIGAGLAGLTAAHVLQRRGYGVVVFDKGRGPGGRTSRRRATPFHFDHGAQYFTARAPRFKEYVGAWIEDGLVRSWPLRLATAEGGVVTPHPDAEDRYVAVPGMNAVARHLAADLEVRLHTRVVRAERADGRWHLEAEGGAVPGSYDVVLVATPPEQALPLLADAPHLAERARAAVMAPCWAVLLGFDAPLDFPYDGVFIHGSPLAWAARNNTKPERPPEEAWVLHAAPGWTRAHLEQPPEIITGRLTAQFFEAIGRRPETPVFATAHRWRYARAEAPLLAGCLWDDGLRLGACGDWCRGARVEDAFLSGLAAAERIAGED